MFDNFSSETVATLQTRGILRVEDGNHGNDRPRPEEFGRGNTSFIRAADMDGGRVLFQSADKISDVALARIRKGKGKPGDILFSSKGTVGKLAIVPLDAPPFVCSPQTTFWRTLDENKLDGSFLYAFMQSSWFTKQWMAIKGDTDMADYASLTSQRQFRVPLPEINFQRDVANVFRPLHAKIELNRRTNRTLESLATVLFRSWFVDFDPVVAKVAGRKPAHLRPELASLFPAHFQDSELGPIPDGWRVGAVHEIMEVTMGQSPPGDTYNKKGKGVPFFQGRTDFGFRFPTKRIFCTAPTRHAKKGDVLLSVRAPVGDTNIALEDCAIGRGLAALRGRNDERSFPLYAMRLQTDEFASFEGEGTLFGAINGPALRGLRLIVPAAPIIEAFEKCAVPWDSMIEHNDRESQTLALMRDTLLPKLLSGELRLKQAEKLLAGVM